jgi:hypothetical protein
MMGALWYRQVVFAPAAERGYIGRMKLLLALGANPDEPPCQTGSCLTPLFAAAKGGHNDAVQLLIGDHGANVNRKLLHGQPALTAAVFNGHADAVSLLLSHGADVQSEWGWSHGSGCCQETRLRRDRRSADESWRNESKQALSSNASDIEFRRTLIRPPRIDPKLKQSIEDVVRECTKSLRIAIRCLVTRIQRMNALQVHGLPLLVNCLPRDHLHSISIGP